MVGDCIESKKTTWASILLMASRQLANSGLISSGKPGRPIGWMLHPTLQGTLSSFWNVLPKRIAIKDLLLLKINYNRYLSSWYIFCIFQTFFTLVILTFYSLSTMFYVTFLYDFPQPLWPILLFKIVLSYLIALIRFHIPFLIFLSEHILGRRWTTSILGGWPQENYPQWGTGEEWVSTRPSISSSSKSWWASASALAASSAHPIPNRLQAFSSSLGGSPRLTLANHSNIFPK